MKEESYLGADKKMPFYIAHHTKKKLIPRLDAYGKKGITQKNCVEYYPFGMQTASSWTRDTAVGNNFLYDAGSEVNTTSGFYDLPYRNYDATLGRFFQVDPLAHLDHNMTPYHYAGNNPIGSNDPTGLYTKKDPSLNEQPEEKIGGAAVGVGDHDLNGIADWAERRDAEVSAMFGYDGGKYGGTLGRWVMTTTTTEGQEVTRGYTTGPETVWEEGTTTTSYNYEYNPDYDPEISFNPPNGQLTQSSPPPTIWGKMYIISNVNATGGLQDGHAWIRMEPVTGPAFTISLWGNRGPQELWKDLELSAGYGVVSKSATITDTQYNTFYNYVSNPANCDWTIFNTCAGFSTNVWNITTGDNLSAMDL